MKKVILIIALMLFITGCEDKNYTVTFLSDGLVVNKINILKGETIELPKEPTKEGYLFVAWLLDGNDYDLDKEVNSDITLTASWTKIPTGPNTHNVTFNFGSYMKDVTVDDGAKVEKPKNDPTMENHLFLGWYDGEELYNFDTIVTKDIVLMAKYQKNRVVINYDLNGGSGTTVQVEIDAGAIPDKPKDPVKFGYQFINWLLGGQPYNFDFPINENTTIKANYVAIEYCKVTFDTAGGESIKSEMIASGDTLKTLPTPKKEGYVFKYWLLSDNEFNANTKITEDITLVAIYEEENKEIAE